MKLEPLFYVSNLRDTVKFYCQVLGFDQGIYHHRSRRLSYHLLHAIMRESGTRSFENLILWYWLEI